MADFTRRDEKVPPPFDPPPPPINIGQPGLNGFNAGLPPQDLPPDPYQQVAQNYRGLDSAAYSSGYHGERNVLPKLEDAAAGLEQAQGTGRRVAGMADTFDPAASRARIFDREGAMRQRVAQRAAAIAALDARTKAAPSAAAAQARVDASRAAAAGRAGMGAGGLLGARNRMERAARTDQAVSANAGQRAGQEAVARLAERASYRSGAGQVLGTGGSTSASMLRAGADAERRAVGAQTDLVTRGTALDRDLAVQRGKTLGAAGNVALDWSGRRGKAGANLARNIGLLEADRVKFAEDMDAINRANYMDKIRGAATVAALAAGTAVKGG